MPMYEYVCEDCHSKFEISQHFDDPPLDRCDECGGNLKKVISLVSFHLKGTGWYKTDYKEKPAKKTEEKK